MKAADLPKFLSGLKERLMKDKKAVLTVFLGILGMFLILMSSFTEKPPVKNDKPEAETDVQSRISGELEDILSQISGAGRVRVMLTFDSAGEKIYAADTDENSKAGSNAGEEHKLKSEHIIIKGQQGEEGLIVKDIYPRVRGVAVVCDGAADPYIKGQIISAVSALFDINSTKISVAEMAG